MHDSHLHIAMSPLKENLESDIQDFLALNGKKILAQTTDISDYQDTINLIDIYKEKYSNLIDLALGLHPERLENSLLNNDLNDIDIFKYGKKQLDIYEDIFKRNINKVKAIGECGLDYFSMEQYNQFSDIQKEQLKEIQQRVFHKLCKLAIKHNLAMSIHSRDTQGSHSCTKDTLSIIAKEGKGVLRGCFHSYTGSLKMLNTILDMGMNVGFNAIITYPSGGNVRELLAYTPIDRVLFETDGPFLPTQSVRRNKKLTKRYGRPVLIKEIMETACEIKGISFAKMEDITDQNYTKLFS